jgi:hypothetical protein
MCGTQSGPREMDMVMAVFGHQKENAEMLKLLRANAEMLKY